MRSHASDYQLDPDKIAVAGGSAGGHLAAALGTIGSDETVPAGYRPNLSVLYYPVIDMVSRGYGFPEIKRDFEKTSPSPSCAGSSSLHSYVAWHERSYRIGRNDRGLSR
ncbi:MAG: alpha/beta hydrolase [Parabacteroides merdae]